ncbi:phosphoribulokinase [Niveibacterium umoris]|uniref:phosphoribulokinase n=1 Tax=Niveibacterium umoris TaxID=1193620 RepID=A0A840BWX4_9RHOO|nr:phosphoribulokinase [Niveibacterium umoris]
MSAKHPIIAVTGSSGAGTSTVQKSFEWIFRRELINAAFVAGDAFHRYDREGMRRAISKSERAGEPPLSHFGPAGNLFNELEATFKRYGESGTGRRRWYLHDETEASQWKQPQGTFTPWEDIPADTDCMLYEGLHGGIVTDTIDLARYVDLLIGVVPIINLEWVQKVLRDTSIRGYSIDAVQDTILRRMPDYVHYIVPQFSRTHINFQRVPLVDTSNPFIARGVPTLDESMVVIRFRDPKNTDFPYLLTMLSGSWMSRPNTLVVPGGKMDLAIQVIMTPLVLRLVERRRALL